MKSLLYVFMLLVISTVLGLSLADVGHTRDKRSVMRLGEMISCTTKKNMMEVLQQFNGYGCWCGFGGKGQAIDPVDGCCQGHDECYTKVIADGACNSNEVYTVDYKRSCKNAKASCSSKAGTCAEAVCECDQDVAKCFATNMSHYNKKYKGYPRDKLCR